MDKFIIETDIKPVGLDFKWINDKYRIVFNDSKNVIDEIIQAFLTGKISYIKKINIRYIAEINADRLNSRIVDFIGKDSSTRVVEHHPGDFSMSTVDKILLYNYNNQNTLSTSIFKEFAKGELSKDILAELLTYTKKQVMMNLNV